MTEAIAPRANRLAGPRAGVAELRGRRWRRVAQGSAGSPRGARARPPFAATRRACSRASAARSPTTRSTSRCFSTRSSRSGARTKRSSRGRSSASARPRRRRPRGSPRRAPGVDGRMAARARGDVARRADVPGARRSGRARRCGQLLVGRAARRSSRLRSRERASAIGRRWRGAWRATSADFIAERREELGDWRARSGSRP